MTFRQGGFTPTYAVMDGDARAHAVVQQAVEWPLATNEGLRQANCRRDAALRDTVMRAAPSAPAACMPLARAYGAPRLYLRSNLPYLRHLPPPLYKGSRHRMPVTASTQ